MKYKENETLEEVTVTNSLPEESSANTLEKDDLSLTIRKTINLRIKILEDSLTDLKNALIQLEDLYNERDDYWSTCCHSNRYIY